jgi:hypothetical protein
VDGKLVGVSASAAVATSVGGTTTPINFGNTLYDTRSAFSSPNFIAPVAGRYRISATIQPLGLSVGNSVMLSVFKNGAQSRVTQHYAGPYVQSLTIEADLLLAQTDAVTIHSANCLQRLLDRRALSAVKRWW